MQFVREMFWMGMDTEAEYKQEMGYADEEDPYIFNEKSLEPFKKWEQCEIPENIRIIKPVEKLVRTCKRIKDEPLNGLRYNTEFPETILWKDNGNIIENLLTEFEQMEAEGDWYNPHAGGLLWEGKNLNDFKTILSEVKTYIRQKNELVKGILTFKGDMKKWQK